VWHKLRQRTTRAARVAIQDQAWNGHASGHDGGSRAARTGDGNIGKALAAFAVTLATYDPAGRRALAAGSQRMAPPEERRQSITLCCSYSTIINLCWRQNSVCVSSWRQHRHHGWACVWLTWARNNGAKERPRAVRLRHSWPFISYNKHKYGIALALVASHRRRRRDGGRRLRAKPSSGEKKQAWAECRNRRRRQKLDNRRRREAA